MVSSAVEGVDGVRAGQAEGIIKLEEDSERLVDLLAAEECAIGAPTLVETRIWCATNLAGRTSRWLEEFINEQGISIVYPLDSQPTRNKGRNPKARRHGADSLIEIRAKPPANFIKSESEPHLLLIDRHREAVIESKQPAGLR
jgi:hypothetical protein